MTELHTKMDFAEAVKNQVNIKDLIERYVSLKKQGQNYVGLCPFHKETTPSFSVSEDKQIFNCFGCHQGGDIFKFVCLYENVGFKEAVKIVATKFGIPVPEIKWSESEPRNTTEVTDREAILEIHKLAAEFYRQCFLSDEGLKARDYLKDRGINEETVKKYDIQYAPDAWDRLKAHLGKNGYSEKELEASGLFVKRKKGEGYYDRFRNRLMFPLHSVNGDIIGFSGRALDGSEPKYLNSPETCIFKKGEILYGLNFTKDKIKDSGHAIVVEGNFDIISLHQAGFANAVAPLGTSFTEGHARLLSKYTKKAYLAFDQDSGGQKATLRTIEMLVKEEFDFSVRIVEMPEGYDPDKYLEEGNDFQPCIDDAEDAIKCLINRIHAGTDKTELPDKLDSIMKILATMNKAKAHAHLKHTIKQYFNLTGPEIKDYEDIEKKYRDERNKAYDHKKQGAESENGPFSTDKVLEILKNQKNRTLIHPAQDYVNGIMNFSVKVGKDLCLLTSDRKVYRFQEIQQAGFEIEHNMVTMTKYSPRGICRFLEDKEIQIDIPGLFHSLYDYINRFIYFKDRAYSKLIALWIMGTYIYRIFYCYPYLWIKAGQGSGKTLLMEILDPIAFNGTLITDPSEAYIFREVAYDQGDRGVGPRQMLLYQLLNLILDAEKGLRIDFRAIKSTLRDKPSGNSGGVTCNQMAPG